METLIKEYPLADFYRHVCGDYFELQIGIKLRICIDLCLINSIFTDLQFISICTHEYGGVYITVCIVFRMCVKISVVNQCTQALICNIHVSLGS